MKTIYLGLIFFISCQEHFNSKNQYVKKITPEDSLKETLVGQWGGLGEDSPVWEIKKDSIYYFQRSTAYAYRILNGDFLISFPEATGIFKKIYVVKDTLFFLNEQGGLIKGYRFTKK